MIDILLRSKLMIQAKVGVLSSVSFPDSYSTRIAYFSQGGTLYDCI